METDEHESAKRYKDDDDGGRV